MSDYDLRKLREIQKRCVNTTVKKVNYLNGCTPRGYMQTSDTSKNCRPFGYQPKRPNPGGLKFSIYDYPFREADGNFKNHPGMGWYAYQQTGKYDTWW